MSAINEKVRRGMAVVVAIGNMVPAFAAPSHFAPGLANHATLQCRAMIGTTDIAWAVELDNAIPLAVVNGEDTPAEYTRGHVKVRLAAGGPNLLIGLLSGRLLATAVDGTTLGNGICKPLTSSASATAVPIDQFYVPEKLFNCSRPDRCGRDSQRST